MADRAVLFIDGNNWYHSLSNNSVRSLFELDYAKISRKLVSPREWVGTRYYIGRVPQTGNTTLYTNQRRFLARLQNTHKKITTHLGRLEQRREKNVAAEELLQYLNRLPVRIDQEVYRQLHEIASKHRRTAHMVEKAVDVMLAVDMIQQMDNYDAAYLLSADGDFTPAVEAVRQRGKKVYAVSLDQGAQLARAVNAFIPLKAPWFSDCYRSP